MGRAPPLLPEFHANPGLVSCAPNTHPAPTLVQPPLGRASGIPARHPHPTTASPRLPPPLGRASSADRRTVGTSQHHQPPSSTRPIARPVLHAADRRANSPQTLHPVRHIPWAESHCIYRTRRWLHTKPRHNQARQIGRTNWAWHSVFRLSPADLSRPQTPYTQPAIGGPPGAKMDCTIHFLDGPSRALRPRKGRQFCGDISSKHGRRQAQGRANFCVEMPPNPWPPPCTPGVAFAPATAGWRAAGTSLLCLCFPRRFHAPLAWQGGGWMPQELGRFACRPMLCRCWSCRIRIVFLCR